MTDQQFQHQVVSALEGIEKILKETSVNFGLSKIEEPPQQSWEGKRFPSNTEQGPVDYTLAHICTRVGKKKLMPYPTVFCSMCNDPKNSINLFIEKDSFKRLEDLLKNLS